MIETVSLDRLSVEIADKMDILAHFPVNFP
jgi:hypothetical protein